MITTKICNPFLRGQGCHGFNSEVGLASISKESGRSNHCKNIIGPFWNNSGGSSSPLPSALKC